MMPQAATPQLDMEKNLRERAASAGSVLRIALGNILGELAGAGIRDQKAISAALGLSQSAVSRLLSSVRSGDSLTMLTSLPGLEGLRQLRKGAAKSGVKHGSLERLDAAIGDMDEFLKDSVGDRTCLEAVLSEWVSESREAFELRHKSAAFKAMSALRGVQADAILCGALVHPSDKPGLHNSIGFDARLGCRRLRPSGLLRIVNSYLAPEGAPFTISSANGKPIESMADMLLPQFSTIGAHQMETRHHGPIFETSVYGLPLGRGTERGGDLVAAQFCRGIHRSVRAPGSPPSSGVGGQAEPPAETFIVDALLHDDVWPGIQPELRMFDTVVRGITHPDNPARQGDRIELLETITPLGRGIESFRLSEFPRYIELLSYFCEKEGWNPQAFRGYRCKIRFPLYGSQMGLAFKLPEA
jgi:hypothetical protein